MVQSDESTHWRFPLAFRDDGVIRGVVAAASMMMMMRVWQRRRVMVMVVRRKAICRVGM